MDTTGASRRPIGIMEYTRNPDTSLSDRPVMPCLKVAAPLSVSERKFQLGGRGRRGGRIRFNLWKDGFARKRTTRVNY